MNAVFSESVRVSQHGSSFAFERKLLISTGKIDRDIVLLRVGAAGYANKSAELEVGEFIFFERASDEIYEVRVINIQAEFRPYIATYLVSRVNPYRYSETYPALMTEFYGTQKMQRNNSSRTAREIT